MTVLQPTDEQVYEIAEQLGMNVDDAKIALLQPRFADYVSAYKVVDEMVDPLPEVKYPRTPGYRPEGDENPHNAWYYKTKVKGAASGKLAGKTVALKDNVMLAGVPMMNGSATLEGFVPNVDATVATRILDAGATILGKAHCECFCLSGGSHTNATGAVENPRVPGHSAGGSSSGSAALIAADEVDMTIGGDQGGSVRIPAAYCGIVAMKATYGLVPYTGVMPIEPYIDHTGPMTANVADNALMLEVIAGPDGYDTRQQNVVTQPYSELLEGGVAGMKIAVLKEGFGHENSEVDVDAFVRAGAARFAEMGATVDEVSIPMHLAGPAIWTPIALEGLTQTMMLGDGYGVSRRDLYSTSLMDAHQNWREKADSLSETLKLTMMFGQHADNTAGKRYYGKAVNLSYGLRAAYDAVLADYDLLLLPTLPVKATPLPTAEDGWNSYIDRAFEMIGNTAPFNISHHPALSMPCGMSDGKPVGMMLVGRFFDEARVYQAAQAFEQSGDWTTFTA
ncbi:MAG: amidase [Alphaproteobacteria bacterium]|jgi:amidase|nr:amidase [Alphaproteobacteria bacterium]